MNERQSGYGVSQGIAIGHALRIEHNLTEIMEITVPDEGIEDEVSRFRRAVRLARQQLKEIRNSIPETTRADIADFIDTHLLMLEDSMLTLAPVELIRKRHCNAEWALKSQRDDLASVFDEMDDPYLRTRKDDVDHVVKRIMLNLLKQETLDANSINPDFKNAIVLSHDLTPAETILLQHQGIAGFVTETGGPLSHTAILARNLGIPAITGCPINRSIQEGDQLILDGETGQLIHLPDLEVIRDFRKRQRDELRRRTGLNHLKDEPTITKDGTSISLNANIDRREDVKGARRYRAEGVGLYRTEFLFMNRQDVPSEEEQYQHYCAVIKSLKGMPLTIRTLDLGADKGAEILSRRIGDSPNPALGLRAIRLCLKHTDLFYTQLRAILRASAKGPVRIMIPMLSSDKELIIVREIINEIMEELSSSKIDYDKNLPVGGMIEVPAAALSSSLFARHLDFLSIGTNDLIQYTLAIDRMDDEVTYLYDPVHPSVLRLIQMTIDAGKKANVPVSMCGEMASDTRYTRLLLGMGLRDFSIPPSALLEVKAVITNADLCTQDSTIQLILASDNSADIETHLKTLTEL